MNTIGYETTDNSGGHYPRLQCAGCGKLIQLGRTGTDSSAKVIWNEEGQIAFMHQMCDDKSYRYWEPIDVFFRNLLHNTRLTTKRLNKPDPFEEAFGVASKPRAISERSEQAGVKSLRPASAI
jgi:hypothetical protein